MLHSRPVNTALIIIGVVCALGIIASLILQLKKSSGSIQTRDWATDIAKLEKELEAERKEKNELSGKGKELFGRFKDLESEYKSTVKERDALQKVVTKFETMKEAQEKDYRDMVQKMENVEKALEKERQRVIRDDEERLKMAEEERDRLWANHENAVVATLSDLCKLPQFQFTSYTNNNLPEDFTGKLKPDFFIDFLGQYVIFDAKVSKAQSLQTYIDEAVKSTAEKVKKNGKIYPHVFLVVPTEAISELKKLMYAKDEFYFYIVSREALAPILASLKRISTYELAEQLDPQKRENIINVIAELSLHISYRNAHELLLTKMGAETLERTAILAPEIAQEVEQKQAEKKLSQLTPTEIKRLTGSLTEQNITMTQLASPKASVKKSMIEAAESVIAQKLL